MPESHELNGYQSTGAARLLSGAANFRAIASLPAADGLRLKSEVIYRSGELSRLSDHDLTIVESLGIKLIADLRSRVERQRFPARWPALAPARILEMPPELDREAGLTALAQRLAHEPGAAGARRAMLAIYAALPELLAPIMSALFMSIASGWGSPVLIHCHVGKDRTGVAAALLLAALGIEREAVIADYAMTAQRLNIEAETIAIGKIMSRLMGRTLDSDTIQHLLAADADYLEAAFAAIEKNYGSLDDYYVKATGLTAGQRERLRNILLT